MAETWGVRDSRAGKVAESVHADVTDAIRAAARSGLAVWLHADSCTTTDDELGPKCPCRPFKVVDGR